MKLRAYVKKGDFDQGLTMNYRSGYSTNSISQPTYCVTSNVAAENLATCGRVKANTTFDYNLAYSGIPHVKLNLYVDNIFNQPAPIDWRGGWDLTAPQFRVFGVAASYTF
jgi:iron complex outermembrane receptor protein